MIRLLPFTPNDIQMKYYFLNENSIHEFRYINNANGVFINIEDVLEIIDIGSSLTEEAKDVNKLKYDYSFPLKGYVNIKNIKLNSYSYQAVPHFVVLCEFLVLLLKDVGDYFYDEDEMCLKTLYQSELNKKYKNSGYNFTEFFTDEYSIKSWLEDNNKVVAVYIVERDLTVTIIGDLILKDLEIFNLPIIINSVYNFDVSEAKIKNMIGFPKEVLRNFSFNQHYTDFDINHFPNKINGKKVIKENIHNVQEVEEIIKKDLGALNEK